MSDFVLINKKNLISINNNNNIQTNSSNNDNTIFYNFSEFNQQTSMLNNEFKKNNKININESEIFEYNNMYIEGFHYKSNILDIINNFNQLNYKCINFNINKNNAVENFLDTNNFYKQEHISTNDLYDKTIEEEVEQLIINERNKILKKKIFGLFRDSSRLNNLNIQNNKIAKNKIFNVYNIDKKSNCNVIEKDNNINKKKYNIENNKNINNSSKDYNNYTHLRNEAKVVEESLKKVKIKGYKDIINSKFNNCNLMSYHFYRKYYDKKEIGRENNYIFNFNDNFLSDINSIDKSFFKDYYKNINQYSYIKVFQKDSLINKKLNYKNNLIEDVECFKTKAKNNNHSIVPLKNLGLFTQLNNNVFDMLTSEIISKNNLSNVNKSNNIVFNKKNSSIELIYTFGIYHPLKSIKCQNIEVLGSANLCDLRDKIYCIIDEIDNYYSTNYSNNANNNSNKETNFDSENNLRKYGSFFFIENNFYNDLRKTNCNLSNKVVNTINDKSCSTNNNLFFNKDKKLLRSNISHDIYKNKNPNELLTFLNNSTITLNDNISYNYNNKNANNAFSCNNMYSNLTYKNVFNYYKLNNYCFDHNYFLNDNKYKEINMSSFRIDHIIMRIGYPYLFRHQEYCDHMVILTDIRVLDDFDLISFTNDNGFIENSIITYQKKLKRRICEFCSFYYAK